MAIVPYDPTKPPVALQDIAPSVLGALGVPVKIDGYLAAGGGYDTATQAAIAAKQAAGWPDTSILVNVLGTSA
jgi:hypothetical protein